jgi:DNA repair protein RecN (Recombination protein N)
MKTKTTSNIRLLNHDERIHEIAKMLSGEIPSQAAIENAKELLI